MGTPSTHMGYSEYSRAAQQRLARALAHKLVVVAPEDVHEAAWEEVEDRGVSARGAHHTGYGPGQQDGERKYTNPAS